MKQKQQKKKISQRSGRGQIRSSGERKKKRLFVFVCESSHFCPGRVPQRRRTAEGRRSLPRDPTPGSPNVTEEGPRRRGRACRILGVFEFNCLSGLRRHEAPAQRRARCGVPPNSSMRSPVSPFVVRDPVGHLVSSGHAASAPNGKSR